MIRNRNQKRGRHDDQDMGGDIDVGANPANIEDANDSDEEQGGGWASDDDEPTKGTGNARVGDDNVEVKTKDGKITSVEGESQHACSKSQTLSPGAQGANSVRRR